MVLFLTIIIRYFSSKTNHLLWQSLKEKLDQWNKEPTEEEKAAKELEEKQRELEEKRKELEKKQKELEEEKEAAEKKEAVNGVALRAAFGEPVFYIFLWSVVLSNTTYN